MGQYDNWYGNATGKSTTSTKKADYSKWYDVLEVVAPAKKKDNHSYSNPSAFIGITPPKTTIPMPVQKQKVAPRRGAPIAPTAQAPIANPFAPLAVPFKFIDRAMQQGAVAMLGTEPNSGGYAPKVTTTTGNKYADKAANFLGDLVGMGGSMYLSGGTPAGSVGTLGGSVIGSKLPAIARNLPNAAIEGGMYGGWDASAKGMDAKDTAKNIAANAALNSVFDLGMNSIGKGIEKLISRRVKEVHAEVRETPGITSLEDVMLEVRRRVSKDIGVDYDSLNATQKAKIDNLVERNMAATGDAINTRESVMGTYPDDRLQLNAAKEKSPGKTYRHTTEEAVNAERALNDGIEKIQNYIGTNDILAAYPPGTKIKDALDDLQIKTNVNLSQLMSDYENATARARNIAEQPKIGIENLQTGNRYGFTPPQVRKKQPELPLIFKKEIVAKTNAAESPVVTQNPLARTNTPAVGSSGLNEVTGLNKGIVPEVSMKQAVGDIPLTKKDVIKATNAQYPRPQDPLATGERVETFTETLRTANEIDPTLKEFADIHRMERNTKTHADTVAAADKITEGSYEEALARFKTLSSINAIGSEDVIVASRLIAEANKRGLPQDRADILSSLTANMANAGQVGESVKILLKANDPTAIHLYFNKAFERINEQTQKVLKDKAPTLKLTDDEIKAIDNLANIPDTPIKEVPKKQSTPRAKKIPTDAEVAAAMKRDEIRAKVIRFAEEQESAARQRIASRKGRLNAVIIPAEDMADYAVIGAAKIAKGTVKFSKWAEDMVKEFGDGIKSRLPEIYEKAKSLHKENVGKLTIDEYERGIKPKSERQLATEQLLKEIGERIAEEIPATNREKFDAWRKMAMLANVKTHARNLLGNLAMAGERRASDTVAAIGEDLAERFGILKQGQRTKSLGWSKDKGLVQLVKDDWENIADDITKHGRWDIVGSSHNMNFFIPEKDMFKTGWLQAIYKKSSNALNKEDVWFMRPAYEDALGGFMKARGLKTVTVEAREYAQRRALEATFRQHSDLASFINGLKAKGGVIGTGIDVLQPFVKTPINIAKNAASYSPLGVLRLFEKYNREPAKIIEIMAQGLTGSMITALGAYSAAQGWARAESLRSKAGEQVLSMDGNQPYSLNIAGTNVTMDWAQPTMSAFFSGVSAWEKATNDEKRSLAASLGKGAAAFADSLLGMSVFRTAQDLMSGNGSVGTKLAEIPLNYIEQTVPTALGQLTRTIDPIKRNTFDNNPLIAFEKRMMSKTPFLSTKLEPKVDVLGNPMKQGNGWEQFLSPGYVKTKSKDPVVNELARLYKATDNSTMLPNVAPAKVRFKGIDINLTDKEVTKFQTIMGQANKRVLDKLIAMPEYTAASDEDKAKLVKKYSDKIYDLTKEQFLIYKVKKEK